MKELGLRRSERLDPDPDDDLAQLFPPFVTISREPGSGGTPIGKLVAKKLGFKLYDSALIDSIAKSAKTRKNLIKEVDEKGRNLMTDLIHNLFNPDYVSDVDYMRHLCKVVLSIAYQGKAVIIGRGSNFITPNAAGLHVRVTAPYRVRLRRAMQYEGHTEAKAASVIRENSNDRREFTRQYFGKNIGNPKYYDLVLNTTFYNLDQSAQVIVTAFKKKFAKGMM